MVCLMKNTREVDQTSSVHPGGVDQTSSVHPGEVDQTASVHPGDGIRKALSEASNGRVQVSVID